MDKKFEINRTKIKGGCQSGRKMVTHNSKSNLPLVENIGSTDCSTLDFTSSMYYVDIMYNRY